MACDAGDDLGNRRGYRSFGTPVRAGGPESQHLLVRDGIFQLHVGQHRAQLLRRLAFPIAVDGLANGVPDLLGGTGIVGKVRRVVFGSNRIEVPKVS